TNSAAKFPRVVAHTPEGRSAIMTQTAKENILKRIRSALANASEPPPVPHDYRTYDEREHTLIVEDFIERLLDYKALVTCTDEATLPQAIADACQQHD